MKISGIRALVTGAASGIGLATAQSLLDGGAACVGMLDRNRDGLDAAVDGLKGRGGRVVSLPCDVTDHGELSGAFANFLADAGGLDALVNGAGVLLDGAVVAFTPHGLMKYPPEKWDSTIDTNLRGTFWCSQLAAEHMFRHRIRGVIVNLSSISRAGRPGQAAYSASKGGIASLTMTLAQELAPWGIRCVAVAPGLVDTPMAGGIPEEHRRRMVEGIAVQRMGRAEEIAHGVVFCIENDFFNGRVLELDGGTLVR